MSMSFGRILLGASALIFIAYGTVCLFDPNVPAGFTGLEVPTGDAFAEVAGMYGGLQTGIGLFCLLAFFNREFYRSGLMALGLTMGALAMARMIAILATVQPVTAYSHAAFGYELVTAALAFLALSRTPYDST
tara:strand:- start:1641 stop:2039 length:399 start_codon:yes stop_codon:yes gene_type:complete